MHANLEDKSVMNGVAYFSRPFLPFSCVFSGSNN